MLSAECLKEVFYAYSPSPFRVVVYFVLVCLIFHIICLFWAIRTSLSEFRIKIQAYLILLLLVTLALLFWLLSLRTKVQTQRVMLKNCLKSRFWSHSGIISSKFESLKTWGKKKSRSSTKRGADSEPYRVYNLVYGFNMNHYIVWQSYLYFL